MPIDRRRQKDRRIRETLFSLPEFIATKTILFYASFRSEVGTLVLIRESLAQGKKILLPKVNREKSLLDLYEIRGMDELFPGYAGIPEPNLPDGRASSLDAIDLAIVPGVAFDTSGNRLGYGAGYYDKLLSGISRSAPIVALAYEEQMLDAIPAEDHDVRVTIILTDKRVIRIQ